MKLVLALALLSIAARMALQPIAAEEKITKPSAPLPPSKFTPMSDGEVVETFRPLYSMVVDEKSNSPRAKKYSFTETKRDEKTSVVVLKYFSGGALGWSFTFPISLQRLAMDRDAKYIMILEAKKSKDGDEFLIGFAAAQEPNPAKFFGLTGPVKMELRWHAVEKLLPDGLNGD